LNIIGGLGEEAGLLTRPVSGVWVPFQARSGG
jgi:hypothetical protein